MSTQTALHLIQALTESNAGSFIETHSSWVLLTGRYAYKIKKPVNFGFLDFSTLEQRRDCCNEELRLNRRWSPELYLEVVAITGTPEHPQLEGSGSPIEYAVKMLQFPSGQLLSEYASRKQLNTAYIDQLADDIADFHQTAARTSENSPYGDSADIKHWFIENFELIRPLLADANQQLQNLQQWGDEAWQKQAPLMQQRKYHGWVREGHGDLHLGNMTLINGKVKVFDCIEFNPRLRWLDVISDVAFLFIDLLRFGYDDYAYRFLNRYIQHTGDYQGLALLRYYSVYRALVRAKVALLSQAQQAGPTHSDYAVFADLAERLIQPQAPVLIITHGYSGSGKSTFSAQLAEKIGAFQIRSDMERKRLFGYPTSAQTGSAIDAGLYSPEASHKTYQHLNDLAKTVLEAGFTVIVDAAFLNVWQRELFSQLATNCGVPFHILVFQASDPELCRRLKQRQNDPSEATLAVLHQQQLTPLLSAGVITINTESDNALENLLNNFLIQP